MAIMIPTVMEEDNFSYGEREVFKALKEKLSNDYTVFHSIRWNARNEKNTVVWGESDFTVFHPKKGIIVIEVKSGGIECINNKWNYIRTDNGERHSMKNPLKQADKSKYRFIDLIDDLFIDCPENDKKYCMVESAVWFPSVKNRDTIGTLPMEFHNEITLLEDALKKPQSYIESLFDFYEGYKHTNLDEKASEKIKDAFAPHYQVMPSLRSKRIVREEMFLRLTKEQNYLLEYLDEQRTAAIQGTAGTGKTLLAIEKAKRLAKTGKVLFLCYNKFLREYLREQKETNKKLYENIEFYSLPKLACEKLHVPKIDLDGILDYLESYDDYEWEYKHIVIDEGQDFKQNQIERLSDIALLQDGAFYVFFDKNQFVQGYEYPDWLRDAECRLILNTNCRNTLAIANTSGKPVKIKPNVKRKSVPGDMPCFYINGSENEVKKRITKLIDEYRINEYSYENIVILTVKTEESSILKDTVRLGNHNILKERSNRGVLFTTARKFKGLEADAIIIVDVDSDTFKDIENKRLFYVGGSRAKHKLDIVYYGNDDELKEINTLLSDMKFPTLLAGIARNLNVRPIKDID